ncbi:hypothetical protein K491DRAFT_725381 [Lophiostoma macrostomum CBS 122681]|uniref:RING-type domain-containing protein n=1 Tax=Lophiostoma macrostomum CBS 122681 TaxID=1314788 RepID=A0A6A6SZ40_9PLEO|nr:hypothetical protein K491DRAFT_725381 [Lophiostoma macrostomum CBS 122681]
MSYACTSTSTTEREYMGQRQSTTMPESSEQPETFGAEMTPGHEVTENRRDPNIIKSWLDKLINDYSFKNGIMNHPHPAEECEFYRATSKVKDFSLALHASLARGEPHALTAAYHDVLKHLYQQEAPFHDGWGFHDWIGTAMMLHPQRRTALRNSWIYITQSDDDLKTKLEQIIPRHEAHLRELLDVKNLLQDPDELWMFDSGNLKHVRVHDAKKPKLGDVCDICQEEYSSPWTWKLNLPHVPMLCPCGHIFCKSCLEVWRTESPGDGYTCPMCRKCLVCGKADCREHQVTDREELPPMPLPQILGKIKGKTTRNNPLFGLRPETYWNLREVTRDLRVGLALLKDEMRREEISEAELGEFKNHYHMHWQDMEKAVDCYDNLPLDVETAMVRPWSRRII